MRKRQFLVRCPKCNNQQKTQIFPRKDGSLFPVNHWKKCVYCGHRFEIHRSPQRTRIIKEILENEKYNTELLNNEIKSTTTKY